MDAQTILIVDDEAEIVDLMRDFLEVSGFRVLTADHGEAALALLQETAVDCILLDVMMPGLSGFEALRQIRGTTDTPRPLPQCPPGRRRQDSRPGPRGG